jgi:TolB-like protein
LSYTREDTEAARRIADALRAFGVEVWFDQAELRGGDAWDAKIKKQIRECALFMPIVSARTQARGEGYFRREWKLAVERTHDMAASRAFLLPVVIDETPESAAEVPEEFIRVQWTRLPHGVPSPEFVAQVKRLLEEPRTSPKLEAGRLRPAERDKGAAFPRKPRLRGRTLLVAGAALIVMGVVCLLSLRRPAAEPAVIPKPAAAATKTSSAAQGASDKSIAVLPFDNRSAEADTAFFTDGVHEDILTNLALVRELRVVSRTSVTGYRGTTKRIPEIAHELGVAYILEGSVQRVGNKVRVTGQLIRGANDEHVWAKSYDRDLTDVFAIQSALAQEIASALSATISPREKAQLERRPTTSAAAYDVYLKARDLRNHERPTRAALDAQETLLQSAVALDPAFAPAWAELAAVHVGILSRNFDTTVERRSKAKAAIERAVALAPEAVEVVRALATYQALCLRDNRQAAEQLQKLVRQQPNDSSGYFELANIQRRQGRWPDALASYRQATQLDPSNLNFARALYTLLRNGRRYQEARVEQARIVALVPGDIREQFGLVLLSFYANGSTREVDEWLGHLSDAEKNSAAGFTVRSDWAYQAGNLQEFLRLEAARPPDDTIPGWVLAGRGIVVTKAAGDEQRVRSRFQDVQRELRSRVELEPANAALWLYLGVNEAMLGHKDEALRCGRKLVELVSEADDAEQGAVNARYLAMIRAWLGDKDTALAELSRLMHVPTTQLSNVHYMRRGAFYSPLRGDPRFEALLNDPKNNAPLF